MKRRAKSRESTRIRRQTRGWKPGPLHPSLLFGLRFAAGWLFVALLIGWMPWLEEIGIDATILTLVGVFKLFPVPSSVIGNHVTVGTTSFEIVPECTSLMPTAILGSAILAFPASWRSRFGALWLGAAVLWIYNLLRIVVLLGVMRWWAGGFELIHVYLWQPLTLMGVVGFFLFWINRLTPRVAPGSPVGLSR